MSRKHSPVSLSEVHGSVEIPQKTTMLRRLFAFAGPAYLVSVGYMDPGNWATDLEGGSRFGYALIWVLLMSNLMAVLLQALSARLGIVTGRDLARACREGYSRPVGFVLWVICEIAIIACDLAEVIGSAIGLNLLFGIPLLWGVVITAVDVFLLLFFQHLGIRKVEAFILTLVATIGFCFMLEMFLAKPDMVGIVSGFVPTITNESLYVAIGILGATVMPHNLYLHSALVQTRAVGGTVGNVRQACKYNLVDSVIALNAAFFVNAAILILAAAVFYKNGIEVNEIQQAHELLAPLLGAKVASTAFAIALLASGQSSTLTGTLAGQVVMEGFMNFRMRPWLRRMITRSLAIVPAAATIWIMGDTGSYKLLILSQVVLSMQLPFAVVPLIQFTSDRRWMGEFASKLWVKTLAWVAATVIVSLNVWLVIGVLGDWFAASPDGMHWYHVLVLIVALALGVLLLYMIFKPFLRASQREEIVPAPFALPDPETVHYSRIAVALEASASDKTLIGQAMKLAKEHNAQLLLVHVADTMAPRVWQEKAEDREVLADEAFLNSLATDLAARGIDSKPVMGYGSPPDEIVRLVREEQAELLIIGTHGHRMFKDLLLGATATKVRHHIDIPVFMIRVDP
ncbi:MAG: Nramp family divalent metal transporter [Calditrichaeota bacterium]|nr:Nramp family divalent metal transporter [Calditrichota bacterium]